MSEEKYIAVISDDVILGIPKSDVEKYRLSAEETKSFKEEIESDVEGQYYRQNSRGQAYVRDEKGNWERTPWFD